MKYYLPKDKIVWLKKYLNEQLPPKKRKALLDLRLKTHGQFPQFDSLTKNINALWVHICKELHGSPDQLGVEYRNFMAQAKVDDGGAVVWKYIDKNYKEIWSAVSSFDAGNICNTLSFWAQENHIQTPDLLGILLCDDINEFCDQYDKKHCEPEALKKSETTIKAINNLFADVNYNSNEYHKIINAINEYLQGGRQEHIVNNIINE